MKRSTGFRNYVLASGSVANALKNTVIVLYSGPVPATADASIGQAVALCTISVDATGTPVTMAGTAQNGQLTKNSSEVWRGVITTAGNASFFRQQLPSDTGADSATAVRVQGTVGLTDADYITHNTLLQVGDERRMTSYVIGMP